MILLGAVVALSFLGGGLFGAERWVSKGPSGGSVWTVAIHPSDPQTIFAGTRGGGVFRSVDGGRNWTAVNNGLTNPTMDLSVNAVAIDPATPSTLYIGTYNGVFRSTDSGVTWTSVNNGYLSSYDDRNVTSLAIDPVAPANIYAGTWSGVWRSKDRGENWELLDFGLEENPQVRAVVVDPSAPATIFAGTWGGGAFKSTNSGQSWTAINEGLDNLYVQALAIKSGTASILFAGTGQGVYLSVDGGDSWTSTTLGKDGLWIQSLCAGPGDSGRLYAGIYGGLYWSADNGQTWSDVILTPYQIQSFAINPSDPSTVFAGSSGGIFLSQDGGEGWVPSSEGMNALDIWAVEVSPNDSAKVYAGANGGGVYRSRDRAETWEVVNGGLGNLFVHTLAIDPNNTSSVFAGTDNGIYVSADEGERWSLAENSPRDLIFKVAVNPQDSEELFAGTYNQGIFRSTDGGESWLQVNSSPYVLLLAIDPLDPATIYAGTYEQVIRSDDGGETWQVLPDIGGAYSLAVDPVNPSTVYVGTDWDVYRSTDKGNSWSPAGAGLPDGHLNIFGLAIDHAIPSTLYGGVTGVGAFRSRDSGESWTSISDGLTPPVPFVMTVDPLNPSRVYAGAEGGSVFAIDFEGRDLYFAQAGNGGGQLSSQLVLFGLDSSDPTRAQVRIRDDQGQPLPIKLNEEVVPGMTRTTVPAAGLEILSTDGAGPVIAGSVSAYSDRPMGGVILLEGSVGVAGVGNSVSLSNGFIAPMETSALSGISTGIALMNLSNLEVELQLQLCDQDGNVLAATSLTLPGYGRLARFVNEFDWSPDTDLGQFRGLLKVSSNRDIAATVIQTRPGELATMPVVPRPAGAAVVVDGHSSSGAIPQNGTEPPSELMFAQFGNGGDLLSSQVLLVNPGDVPAAATLHLRDDDGQPLAVSVNGQPVEGEIAATIPAGGLRFFETDASGPVQSGSVTVTSDHPLAGVVVFGGQSGVAGVGSSQAVNGGFLAPVLNSSGEKSNTGIAVMNPGDEEVAVHFSLLDSQGQLLVESDLTLPAGGHQARFVNEFTWSDAVDLADFEGLLRAETATPIAATVIQTRPGKLATLPVTPN